MPPNPQSPQRPQRPQRPDPVMQILQGLSRLESTTGQILEALEPPKTDSLEDQGPDPVEDLLNAVQELYETQKKHGDALLRLEKVAIIHTNYLHRIEVLLKEIAGPRTNFE